MPRSDQVVLSRVQMAAVAHMYRSKRAYGWTYPWVGIERRVVRQQSEQALADLEAAGVVKVYPNNTAMLLPEYKELLHTCILPYSYISISAMLTDMEKTLCYLCDKNGAVRIREVEDRVHLEGYIGRRDILVCLNDVFRHGSSNDGAWLLTSGQADLCFSSGERTAAEAMLIEKNMPRTLALSLLDAFAQPKYRLVILTERTGSSDIEMVTLVSSDEYIWALSPYYEDGKPGAQLRLFDEKARKERLETVLGVLFEEDYEE